MSSYSEILAKFIKETSFEELPVEVINKAKTLLLDSVGTALAGHNQLCSKNAFNALKDFNQSYDTQIWGSQSKLNAINAAMLNSIAAHALDFDDTHTEAIVHASAILTPLCLSYGFSVNTNGKDILKAFIIGWEIAARIGIASNGTFHKRGFHTTAIAGIFGSVAACCILSNLDIPQIIAALGLAGSFAGGINEFLSNGSNSKVLHIANAIKNGILVSKFAQANMSGPVTIFEGRDNIFKTFGIEEECNKNKLIDHLKSSWEIMNVSIKPYPCCHFAHGFIDCALLLRKENVDPHDIKNILCFIDEVPASFICSPIENKYKPQNAYAAKFSLPFLMAVAFYDGEITLNSYQNLNRKEIIDFSQKINYAIKKSAEFPKYFPGHIEVKLKNGNSIKKDVSINRGNFDNPLSFEELEQKFKCNAYKTLNNQQILNCLDKIKHLESQTDFMIEY